MLEKNDYQEIANLMNTIVENKVLPRFDGLNDHLEAIEEKVEKLAAKSKVEELEDEIKLLKIVIKQMNSEIKSIKAG